MAGSDPIFSSLLQGPFKPPQNSTAVYYIDVFNIQSEMNVKPILGLVKRISSLLGAGRSNKLILQDKELLARIEKDSRFRPPGQRPSWAGGRSDSDLRFFSSQLSHFALGDPVSIRPAGLSGIQEGFL